MPGGVNNPVVPVTRTLSALGA